MVNVWCTVNFWILGAFTLVTTNPRLQTLWFLIILLGSQLYPSSIFVPKPKPIIDLFVSTKGHWRVRRVRRAHSDSYYQPSRNRTLYRMNLVLVFFLDSNGASSPFSWTHRGGPAMKVTCSISLKNSSQPIYTLEAVGFLSSLIFEFVATSGRLLSSSRGQLQLQEISDVLF
jgi:hypothetical protein